MTIEISDKEIAKIQDLYTKAQGSTTAWDLLIYEMIYVFKLNGVIKEGHE